MIFALREPVILAGLVLGFLVGISLRSAVGRAVAGGGGPRRRRGLRSVGAGARPRGRGPSLSGWSRVLDPYGTVAAVLSGPGWGRPPEGSGAVAVGSRRRHDVSRLVVTVAVHAALAAAGFAAFVRAGGTLEVFRLLDLSAVLHGSIGFGEATQALTAGFGAVNAACALLALTPIPPLDLGVVVWSRLPRSAGARRLAYHLLEEQWGVAIVLVLLLLPLGAQQPVLLTIIDAVAGAVLPQF